MEEGPPERMIPSGRSSRIFSSIDPRRLDLAVDLMFPDPPGDELVVLRSEIDDQDHGFRSFLGVVLIGISPHQRMNSSKR